MQRTHGVVRARRLPRPEVAGEIDFAVLDDVLGDVGGNVALAARLFDLIAAEFAVPPFVPGVARDKMVEVGSRG